MSIAKLWNGSSWSYPSYIYPKVWNGSTWVQAVSRVCTGGTSFESSATDSHTITIGTYAYTYTTTTYFGTKTRRRVRTINYYGYDTIAHSFGSIDNSTTSLFTGGQIQSLFWDGTYLYLTVTNPNLAYDVWSNMQIGSTTFTRSSSTKTAIGTQYNYRWSAASNPIGTSGTVNIFWT